MMCAQSEQTGGWSLMELLCVVAIISILAAIYLGVIAKAFVHVKTFLGGF